MNTAIIQQVVIMSVLVALGYLCRKTDLLDEHSTKKLSTLVLYVATPMVVLYSYQKPFDEKLLNGLLASFLLSIVSYVTAFLIVPLIVHSKEPTHRMIERFSCIYSNCAFMGIPLIQGVYGEEGVFFLTAYYTVFNVCVWTHGQIHMKGSFSVKEFGKALLTPAILGTVVGFVLFMFNILLPDIVLSVIKHLGNLNTPLSMMVAGSTIATTKLFAAIKKPKIYYIAFIRLILIPLLLMLFCLIFRFDSTVSGTNILASACPTAAICTMFAVRFDRDPKYASEIFAITTILSVVTLPLILFVFTSLGIS